MERGTGESPYREFWRSAKQKARRGKYMIYIPHTICLYSFCLKGITRLTHILNFQQPVGNYVGKGCQYFPKVAEILGETGVRVREDFSTSMNIFFGYSVDIHFSDNLN